MLFFRVFRRDKCKADVPYAIQKLLGMIRAVLFDLGGTIIDASGPPRAYEIWDRILRAHGVERPLESIAKAHMKAERTMNVQAMVNPEEEFWLRFNALVLEELGVGENLQELARAIDRDWWRYADAKVYSDVLPVLEALRARDLKLGLVSNCVQNDLRQILPMVGLDGFFDVQVCVGTFRSMKPDREIFAQTLRRLGVSAEEAFFVGDSFERDYEGARSAGMKAVLIDRERRLGQCQAEIIHDFNEILSYL